jgi:hypothetical protein
MKQRPTWLALLAHGATHFTGNASHRERQDEEEADNNERQRVVFPIELHNERASSARYHSVERSSAFRNVIAGACIDDFFCAVVKQVQNEKRLSDDAAWSRGNLHSNLVIADPSQ